MNGHRLQQAVRLPTGDHTNDWVFVCSCGKWDTKISERSAMVAQYPVRLWDVVQFRFAQHCNAMIEAQRSEVCALGALALDCGCDA